MSSYIFLHLFTLPKLQKMYSQYRILKCTFIHLCENIFDDHLSSLPDVLKELDDAYERYRKESDSLQRRKLQLSIQRALIRSQELGDEKIQIAGQMVSADPPAAAPVMLLSG